MHKNSITSNTIAVSEIVGGMLLLFIAVLSFTAIYSFVLPLPEPDVDSYVKLQGYVNTNNIIILEHIGGEELKSYCIDVKYVNNTLIETITPELEWEIFSIGDKPYPINSTVKLNSSDDKIKIVVRKTDEDREIIFEGILQGRTINSQPANDSNSPYLISSLLTDTTNEDLICFNKTSTGEKINLSFSSTSNVYNWKVDGSSIFNILYSFDINNSIKDFSNNNNTGSNLGATWTNRGKIAGAYIFDGDDFITIPYCFSSSTIGDMTIEAWIKTNQTDGTICSFNRSDYFSLSATDGKIRWSSTANGNTFDLIGLIDVSDNNWHHIAVTYVQSTAASTIYVDGILDISSSDFTPGEALGSGSQISGFIGREKGIYTSSGTQSIFIDDFETDKGWTVYDNVNDGEWDRGIPIGGGDRGDPPTDHDGSGNCFLTDNVDGNSDVDDGETFLISPLFDLSSYESVSINYSVWYTNNDGDNDNRDYFYVSISNDNGFSWHTAHTIGPDTPDPIQWYEYEFQAEDFIALTNQVRFRFEVSDTDGGSVVEAGVDAINISGVAAGGAGNFTGIIDELKIYKRSLSEEQIYQNYLIGNTGESDISVLVSEETITGQSWLCEVTPVNQNMYASSENSNQININPYGGG
ncbi:hypothetical protein B6U98_00215 [Thermoplasmatales archaeon ex4572_165]|nr:MAG: hypothetical protein B6U98_00215 [Thermoplasmatales archaeon ex4572_165]